MPRHFERDETGLGTDHRVCAQEFIGEHREAIDPHGFQSLIKRSGFTRSFDPRFDETKVFVEYGVLERDRQRENAVEPALDRGEIIGQSAIGAFKSEAGPLDEIAEARGLELAVIEQLEPAAERFARVVAFEIVGRVEQVLSAGLALAARQRA